MRRLTRLIEPTAIVNPGLCADGTFLQGQSSVRIKFKGKVQATVVAKPEKHRAGTVLVMVASDLTSAGLVVMIASSAKSLLRPSF
jgi:hypothetical protein